MFYIDKIKAWGVFCIFFSKKKLGTAIFNEQKIFATFLHFIFCFEEPDRLQREKTFKVINIRKKQLKFHVLIKKRK